MAVAAITTNVNYQYVKTNIVALARLPEHPVTFTNRGLPDNLTTQGLKKNDIIESVGRERRVYENKNGGGNRDVKLWKLTEAADAQIKSVLDSEYSNKLPCSDIAPHTGFRNIGNGEYECKDCGAVHDRDTIERVLGGGK